jgi:antitoxin CptB
MSLRNTLTSSPDNLDVRRRKLIFRSWRRGTQESDLILGSFADESLSSLDEAQLERFQALLDCSDPDLFDWVFEVSASPPEHDHDVMRLLRAYCALHRFQPPQAGPQQP